MSDQTIAVPAHLASCPRCRGSMSVAYYTLTETGHALATRLAEARP